MTTLIILLLGAGLILIVSAVETDPATGQSTNIRQTISDIWNGKVSFAPSAGAATNAPTTTGTGATGTGPSRASGSPGNQLGTAYNEAAYNDQVSQYEVWRRYGYGLGQPGAN